MIRLCSVALSKRLISIISNVYKKDKISGMVSIIFLKLPIIFQNKETLCLGGNQSYTFLHFKLVAPFNFSLISAITR